MNTVELRHRERGSILVMAAVTMTAILGMTALAIDAGYLFEGRSRMGQAADAAALAGAREILRFGTGIDQTSLQSWARHEAATAGFLDGYNGVSVTVRQCSDASATCSGAIGADANYVEVIIEQPMSTFFMNVFGRSSMNVSARSVAGLGPGTNSIVMLNPSANGALTLSGGSTVSIGGSVIVDSTSATGLTASGGSTLSAGGGIGVSGSDYTAHGCCGSGSAAPKTGIPRILDPLVNHPVPSPDVSCTGPGAFSTFNKNSGTWDLYCGTYNSIGISGSAVVTFHPGVYAVNGNFNIQSGGHASGTDVTFYIGGGGSVIIQNNTSYVDFRAPTTGGNAGILFFQDRLNSTQFKIANIISMNLEGLIYARAAHIDVSGGAGSPAAAYTSFIADTMTVSGGGQFNSDFSGVTGGNPLKTPVISE